MPKKDYIAHTRHVDGGIQTLPLHLRNCAASTESFARAIALPLCGRLLGLAHDLGKYSAAFQQYIRAIAGLLGAAKKEEARDLQGKIDHATAGAQLVWKRLYTNNASEDQRALGQVLAVIIMSHHSHEGMKDFVALDGTSPFLERLQQSAEKTFFDEVVARADQDILQEIEGILSSKALLEEFSQALRKIGSTATQQTKTAKLTCARDENEKLPYRTNGSQTPCLVGCSLLARSLFSCLLDADRLDAADFEDEAAARLRSTGNRPNWKQLSALLEGHLARFDNTSEINRIRRSISEDCRDAASRPQRLLTLCVPTGGGKTLASLRFALCRAALASPEPIDRIIYVIPFTTIIDQNAGDVREILGSENVLEHHSNLDPKNDTPRTRVLSVNWDAPVVFTTSVQFLDCLFHQSGSAARRMHQLAHSIIIFDEIQTLPIKTVHLFNNAIYFLTQHCHCTALLCTATMPLLNKVRPELGTLPIMPEQELIADKKSIFDNLKRTEIIDHCRKEPWGHPEIRDFVLDLLKSHASILVVCNTKKSAERFYTLLQTEKTSATLVFLSTQLCPAHREVKIKAIRKELGAASKPLICISTQLIEAGIDLDFSCVIRSLAGLDSIIQSGGRCNRHGKRAQGPVYILNFAEEHLDRLPEIRTAQACAQRLLAEFKRNPDSLGGNLLSEEAMSRFYEYYFHYRRPEMVYPLKAADAQIQANTSILELLSTNGIAEENLGRTPNADIARLPLHQAYATAARAFEVIDAPTRGVIVPYKNAEKDGDALIGELAAKLNNEKTPLPVRTALLKQAQQFSVNLFPHTFSKLEKQNALHEIQPQSGIFYLDKRHYHDEMGVITEPLGKLPTCIS